MFACGQKLARKVLGTRLVCPSLTLSSSVSLDVSTDIFYKQYNPASFIVSVVIKSLFYYRVNFKMLCLLTFRDFGKKVDLHYYDGLANQDEAIVLTIGKIKKLYLVCRMCLLTCHSPIALMNTSMLNES